MNQLDTQLMHPTEQINVIIGRICRSGMTTTSGGNRVFCSAAIFRLRARKPSWLMSGS